MSIRPARTRMISIWPALGIAVVAMLALAPQAHGQLRNTRLGDNTRGKKIKPATQSPAKQKSTSKQSTTESDEYKCSICNSGKSCDVCGCHDSNGTSSGSQKKPD